MRSVRSHSTIPCSTSSTRVKKSARPTTITTSVAKKTPVLRPLGLPSAAEAPRIGKATTALWLKDAQRLTPAEVAFF